MVATSDGELWRAAREGDADAFGVLFDRHANAVYTFCFRRTANWATAEDLTSVVFFEAWRKCGGVELTSEKVLPWLYGVALNVVRNQRRSLRRYDAALSRIPALEPERDFADDLADRIADQQRMAGILTALGDLPEGEQEVIALCIWQDLSAPEAATALGIPEGTVRTRLHRARARLRELGDESPGPVNSQEGGSWV